MMISFGENEGLKLKLGKRYLIVNGKRAKLFKVKNPGVRTIYTFLDFIIKIDTDVDYRNEESQGCREIELFFEKLKDEDKIYFPKPIDWGVFENGMYWVVQKFESLEAPKESLEKIIELADKYDLIDVYDFDDEDDYDDCLNWALLNGKTPFIYDYAI